MESAYSKQSIPVASITVTCFQVQVSSKANFLFCTIYLYSRLLLTMFYKLFVFIDTAKAYSAILRVSNDAGRTARLIPDKGHAEGFIVQPGKPLEITLVDLSSDGHSVAPVFFNASDAETGLSLLINNNNQPVPITPSESQADYTDLVITVPGILRIK